jgi:hypothetical protein
VTILVSLEPASNPSEWPLPRVQSTILQGKATKSGQSTEAETVHNKKSSKIQRKAL